MKSGGILLITHGYARLGNPLVGIGQVGSALTGPLSEVGSQSAAAVEGSGIA